MHTHRNLSPFGGLLATDVMVGLATMVVLSILTAVLALAVNNRRAAASAAGYAVGSSVGTLIVGVILLASAGR